MLHDGDTIKHPHVFVTNGTGTTEEGKAHELSKMLRRHIDPAQVILATTPMRELAPIYEHQRILFVARSEEFCRQMAKLYGFKNVVTIEEYGRAHPILIPHKKVHQAQVISWEYEKPISAIFLLQVPADWAEALQICVDILRSDGIPGADHESLDQKVKVFSGNPDLDYGALHSVPRMTLGAFRKCLEALFRESAGRELLVTLYGKPFPLIYQYAESALKHQAKLSLKRIYAIGDNPKSDIKGANDAGDHWYSILTRTGCFQGGDNDPTYTAKFVCKDVKEAVLHILEREASLISNK